MPTTSKGNIFFCSALSRSLIIQVLSKMHSNYYDFEHTLSDEARVAFLHDAYERILCHTVEGTYRNINRVMKFLRQSDFYSLPCRHHAFVGGNAWHQLETMCHAFIKPDLESETELAKSYIQLQPTWQESDTFGKAVVCLLHDIGNVQNVPFPSRIMKRHGRRSTYVLIDHLKFELMFDENMAIIYHQQHTPDELRYATPDEEAYERISAFPLYQMVQLCDAISAEAPLAEQLLMARLESLYQLLGC